MSRAIFSGRQPGTASTQDAGMVPVTLPKILGEGRVARPVTNRKSVCDHPGKITKMASKHSRALWPGASDRLVQYQLEDAGEVGLQHDASCDEL